MHPNCPVNKRTVGKFEVRSLLERNNVVVWKEGKPLKVNVDQFQIYHPMESSEVGVERCVMRGRDKHETTHWWRRVHRKGSSQRLSVGIKEVGQCHFLGLQ
ncbi:hypothetical protein TNCT_685261 [Trichonephila clavata]|uniref:Uncharacterized protein n=1 Tax=Trichonephila clavata TaxID=2740835 RepID=A0A8X6LUS0_TRICU|nr:hypothetical protein TNCT_685261 [Trichonephila clavata]